MLAKNGFNTFNQKVRRIGFLYGDKDDPFFILQIKMIIIRSKYIIYYFSLFIILWSFLKK